MVAFFIGAILYFVGYAVQTFRNDITTVTVYETGVEDSMDTTGLVVRQETLLEGSGERPKARSSPGSTRIRRRWSSIRRSRPSRPSGKRCNTC